MPGRYTVSKYIGSGTAAEVDGFGSSARFNGCNFCRGFSEGLWVAERDG